MISIDSSTWTIPDARFGELLERARTERNLDLKQLAAMSGGRYSARTLRRVEEGRLPMLGFDLQSIAALYAVNLDDLVAARAAIEIDLDGRTIAAGSVHTDLESEELDAVLSRYLAVVRELRAAPGTGALPLRDDDVQTLADVLDVDEHDVAHRLGVLMGCSDDEAARAWSIVRNRVVVRGAISLIIGAIAVAGLTAHAGSADATTSGGGDGDTTAAAVTTRPEVVVPTVTAPTTPTPTPVGTTTPAPAPEPSTPAASDAEGPAVTVPVQNSADPAPEIPTEIGTAMTVEKLPDGTIVTEEG